MADHMGMHDHAGLLQPECRPFFLVADLGRKVITHFCVNWNEYREPEYLLSTDLPDPNGVPKRQAPYKHKRRANRGKKPAVREMKKASALEQTLFSPRCVLSLKLFKHRRKVFPELGN